MHFWRTEFARIVVWLLAGIVPTQPLFALDCDCRCHAKPEAACCSSQSKATCHAHKDDDVNGCHHEHRADRCHDEQYASGNDDASGKVFCETLFRAGNCLGHCDCEWQHESKVAVVGPSKVKIDGPVRSFLIAPLFVVTPAVAFASTWANQSPATAILTAQELCAILCRFTA
jgi:hypothetical protein